MIHLILQDSNIKSVTPIPNLCPEENIITTKFVK